MNNDDKDDDYSTQVIDSNSGTTKEQKKNLIYNELPITE